MATRNASQDAIQALAARVPELFGGAADLSESNLTDVKGEAELRGRPGRAGTSASASASTRWAGSPTASPTTAGSSRTSARSSTSATTCAAPSGWRRCPRLHVIYVWTHDSVGLGEDGPTHQPVEHYAALRAIPNLCFVRPGDANETSAAWAFAVARHEGPVALALTRQKLPILPGTAEQGT